jgi:hypothetical protein
MIYYDERPVLWDRKTGLNEIEKSVQDEITYLKNKYFSPNSPGVVRVIYKRGQMEAAKNVFGILKKFPIPLLSSDGLWRYSAARKGKDGFVDSHMFVTYSTAYKEKDIEFLWFLFNRSSVLNKFVFVEDKEAEAKKEVETMATDADIRYAIMGNSPTAKDEKLIRQVSEIFGMKEVEKKGINQVKKELYDLLLDGEKMKDAFVNFRKFEEMTDGSNKRKAAYYAKASISDGTVKYKDRAWYLMSGNEYSEKLMSIQAKDAAFREQLFIDEIVTNPNTRSRLFSAIGQEEIETAEDLRSLDRPVLMKKLKELGEVVKASDTAEVLVEKLCAKLGIKYLQPETA